MLDKYNIVYQCENSFVHRMNPLIKIFSFIVYILLWLLKYNNYLFIMSLSFVLFLLSTKLNIVFFFIPNKLNILTKLVIAIHSSFLVVVYKINITCHIKNIIRKNNINPSINSILILYK